MKSANDLSHLGTKELAPNTSEIEAHFKTPKLIGEKILGQAEVVDTTELHFVYCFHTEQYAGDVVAEIEDADVVAIEYVHPQEARDKAETYANLVTHTDEKLDLAGYFGDPDLRFLHDILELLRGSNKEIHFIDAAEDSTTFKPALKAEEMEDDVYNMLFQRSLAETRSALLSQIGMVGRVDRWREELVREQLADLLEAGKGKKIAVVQGALHSGTAHTFINQSGVRTTRSFVPEFGDDFKMDFRETTPSIVAIRSQRFLPKIPLSPELTNYVLLEHYLSATSTLSFPELDVSPEQAKAALDNISQILDDPKSSEDQKSDLISNIVKELPQKPAPDYWKTLTE